MKIDTPWESFGRFVDKVWLNWMNLNENRHTFGEFWANLDYGVLWKKKDATSPTENCIITSLPRYTEIYAQKKSPTIVELFVVEIVGVEPTTPCLQSRCSSQLSYTPILGSPEQT